MAEQTKQYVLFANSLRKDILSGVYGTQGGLPAVEEMIRTSKLSKAYVYKALAILESENLIVSRNRNFYVNRSSTTMTNHVPIITERLRASGKIAFMRNLEPVERTTLPAHIADRLNLAPGTSCVHRYRIAGEVIADGEEKPTRLLNYYYLLPITDEQLTALNANPETDILRETHPGEMFREDAVSARHLTSQEVKLLGIPEGTPVISMQIVNTTTEGQLLLIQETVFVGETLTYKYPFVNSPAS